MAYWQPTHHLGGSYTRIGTWRAEVEPSSEQPGRWHWYAHHDGDRQVMEGHEDTQGAAQVAAEQAIILAECG